MPAKSHGFRFSVTDGVAIVVCAVATYALRGLMGPFVWLLPISLGHFFLFCNVFRVRRNYELAWAVLFIVNTAVWMHVLSFTWLGVLAVQAPITCLVVGLEIASGQYRGICSRPPATGVSTPAEPPEAAA